LPVPLTVPLTVRVEPPYTRRMRSPVPDRATSRPSVAGAKVVTRPPPARVIGPVPPPKLLAASTRPEGIVTAPVKVLAPASRSRLVLPPPVSLVSPWAARVSGPDPEITEATVVTLPAPAPRPAVSIVPPEDPRTTDRPLARAVAVPVPVNWNVPPF